MMLLEIKTGIFWEHYGTNLTINQHDMIVAGPQNHDLWAYGFVSHPEVPNCQLVKLYVWYTKSLMFSHARISYGCSFYPNK